MDLVLSIQYRFLVCADRPMQFSVNIDRQTLELVRPPIPAPPFWTALDYFRCPNCPLDAADNPHCPLCLALAPVVDRFGGILSCDAVDVEVETGERRIFQNTTVQRALGSLIGLIMAVSGCPHTAFFKPMARFHLPLATEEETIYRASSMYRLAQYYIRMSGGSSDAGLEGLKRIYKNIHQVNMAVAKRIRDATRTDSSINAVIILDMFTKSVPYDIDDSMASIRNLFEEYQGLCQAFDVEEDVHEITYCR